MKNLILMLQFFTRIPINKTIDIKDDSFSKGLVFFPIVGLIIGLFNAAVYFIIYRLFNRELAVLCGILSNLVITGGLHLDGLADTCDGIYSSRTKERMLEIMKDSRVGTNGVIAIFFDLALRFVLLQSLKQDNCHILIMIIILPMLSRSVLTLLIHKSSRDGNGKGLGSLFIGRTTNKEVLIPVGVTMVIGTFALGWVSPLQVFILCIFVLLYRKYIINRLGVITGDILGAGIELMEILALMVFYFGGRLI